MEAWLKTDSIQFRFPIVPQQIEVTRAHKVDTDHLANGSEISIYAGRELIRTSLSSHFPSDKDRTYLDFLDFPDPEECIRIIEEIASSKGEIRYIVTETEVNIPVRITSFKRGLQDGSGDIYFTLDIVEYIPPKAVSWSPPQKNTANIKLSDLAKPYIAPSNVKLNERTEKDKDTKQKYHIVKAGDCLWDIAAKYYKDGRKYPRIKQNSENLKKYPSLKKRNVIKAGWRLVI